MACSKRKHFFVSENSDKILTASYNVENLVSGSNFDTVNLFQNKELLKQWHDIPSFSNGNYIFENEKGDIYIHTLSMGQEIPSIVKIRENEYSLIASSDGAIIAAVLFSDINGETTSGISLRFKNDFSKDCLFTGFIFLEDDDQYITIEQIIGTEDNATILFTNNNRLYALQYPTGKVIVLGDYMQNPSMSPNGRYIAYQCPLMGYDVDQNDMYLFEKNGVCRMDEGVYIKDLKTNQVAYFNILNSYDKYSLVDCEFDWFESSDN